MKYPKTFTNHFAWKHFQTKHLMTFSSDSGLVRSRHSSTTLPKSTELSGTNTCPIWSCFEKRSKSYMANVSVFDPISAYGTCRGRNAGEVWSHAWYRCLTLWDQIGPLVVLIFTQSWGMIGSMVDCYDWFNGWLLRRQSWGLIGAMHNLSWSYG